MARLRVALGRTWKERGEEVERGRGGGALKRVNSLARPRSFSLFRANKAKLDKGEGAYSRENA